MPNILLEPRLWAEEGLFYQNAWSMPAGQALLYEYGGYLNLVATAAGVIARYTVRLRDAPLVTTAIGLLFQTCPAVLILTSQARWLRPRGAMLLAIIAVAAPPATEEVWLQTLHSQNHLALCVALILSFDDRPGPAVRWFRRVLLILAPLSGLLAVLVLPVMLARAAFERTRERTIQCALLAAGALIQVGLFFTPADGTALGRSFAVRPDLLLEAFFVRHVAAPLIGVPAAYGIGDALARAWQRGVAPVWPTALLAAFGAAIGGASLWHWRSGAPWLLAAAVVVGAASYAGAINGGLMLLSPIAAERYSFVPEVLLACSIIAIGSEHMTGSLSRIATFVAAWMIAVGLLDVTRPAPLFATGPDWRTEVRHWEADPESDIRLWPQGWSMQLTRDHGPVSRPVRPPEHDIPPHDGMP